ncbi:MAG: L-seryl-tRNA(Sec) selenium transferase [Desulfobulbus propionicus]|nr:MAG: L-seryl-tRNA(Sec) selenium transferase [Desulfobulbus propionicus]
MNDKQLLLSQIPNMQDCLAALSSNSFTASVPRARVKRLTRQFLDRLREQILDGQDFGITPLNLENILSPLSLFIVTRHRAHFRRVINGTGVIIHTNLGRSLLSVDAMQSIYLAGHKYSNLEFSLGNGKRGSRYSHIEELLCELTGAEAGLVVNNNAAAVLIVLDTLAKGKEAIVSRGQLVEIGGSFRIPDVMARSGAKLVEVGATNRTHLKDYENALNEQTGLLLKVHCSNYRIIGFTSEVSNEELVRLGRAHTLPVVEDLGSGSFIDLSRFGLEKEPTVQEVVQSGVDIVTFSGDKLLGGPQAGIILGRKEYIDKIKKNPLNRALRIDKFTLSGLESTLRSYLDIDKAVQEIPTLKMIAEPVAEVGKRAEAFCLMAKEQQLDCEVSVIDVNSRVGGGAMPEQNLPSKAVAVKSQGCTIHDLEVRLRDQELPVIGRVENDHLLFDMRTVTEEEVALIVASLHAALQEKGVS